MLKIVLFPAPFGPKSPTISPELRLKLILSKICLLAKESDIFSSFAIGSLFFKTFNSKFFN